jgi:hypothetical protein
MIMAASLPTGLHCRGHHTVLFQFQYRRRRNTFTDDKGDLSRVDRGMKVRRGRQHDDCKWQMWHSKIKNNLKETNCIMFT